MYDLLKELFPICRSITGNGVRETFKILQDHIPLEITEHPSGKECFDWVIPDEWNIRSATIKDTKGNILVDFAQNNLHVLGYSEPFSGMLSFAELDEHLYSDPQNPEIIPYLTSYYHRRWGFCLSHEVYQQLDHNASFQVDIDATLEPGSLTTAQVILPGQTTREIFLSCYVCHPSMANDSISGVVLTTQLYKYLQARGSNHYTYRFIFVPETIGALAYLAETGESMKANTECGLVLTCVGGPGPFTYKSTRNGHDLDRIVKNLLHTENTEEYEIRDFFLPGSDERQYSSPGFNLPTGSLMRSAYGFPGYHTSGDDLALVSAESLESAFALYSLIFEALEGNCCYRNLKPFGEPFLSKYDLYNTLGSQKEGQKRIPEILTILNFSDGQYSLLDIAERMDASIIDLIEIAEILKKKGLLEKI